jgi:hypothetical protein
VADVERPLGVVLAADCAGKTGGAQAPAVEPKSSGR